MRLPKNLLSPGTYAKPRIFLCETNKTKICQLETTNTNGTFKFNSYSELSFDVSRVYNDMLTGEVKINPFYDKIESPRLVYLEGFAYFELQGPELDSDGVKEAKSCTAYSLEYTLSTKFIEDFYVNTGKVDSLEVLNADDPNHITPIVLCNENNQKLSLLHLVLEKAYGWKIGHVDSQLKTLSRQFEVDRESIYDFLINEVCEKFNCYIVFDTINNEINLYAEYPTAKFICDGNTSQFQINSPLFSEIHTVSVDGYKTTRWNYEILNGVGILTLEDIPSKDTMVEVVGEDSTWETDVFITFDNLAQQVNVNYEADNIKTVLTVTYGDDLNIRETNMGLPYITDISYYYNVDWMGTDLYNAYTDYMTMCNNNQSVYTQNTKRMLELSEYISFEENRLSLGYAIVSVDAETVGSYYVRGGTYPNYYYSEVSLPEEYEVNTTYYSVNTTNVQDGDSGNVAALYDALQKYFYNHFNLKKLTEDAELYETYKDGMQEALDAINDLADRFSFMEVYTISGLHETLSGEISDEDKEQYIGLFFDVVFEQLGKKPLKDFYYERYKQAQIANIENGHSDIDNVNYGFYYVTVLILNAIDIAIAKRDALINEYETQYNAVQQANIDIANSLIMDTYFTKDQMIRLNAFLREDELHLDDIIETSQTTLSESFKLKQDAMESGRIELQKLCKPQLQFSMSMANIYALPEFEPIVDQFQLGNVIKVGLRRDYIKQSRLLQVNLNFDDWGDFSCEFGDLTSLRTQSDVHADLLKKAVQAGKNVATNSSYWTKGADQANSINLRLEEGLLNSIEALKAIDGTQNAYMDKYGIHLEVVNPDTGEVGDKRVWMVNNQIVFTDDGFKTSKSVLGEFTVDGETYYGLLAQAVIAGYIEGSQIKGGTIQIGDLGDGKWSFEVDSQGNVSMLGGEVQFSASKNSLAETEEKLQGQINKTIEQVQEINNTKMYRVEIITEDPTIISTGEDSATIVCRVYSWDTDITDELDESFFNWKRTSNNTELDNIWNDMQEHQGVKSITIGADDVVDNSSFTCEVNLPE